MNDAIIVGIDLGTTNSLVAHLTDDGARVLADPAGEVLLPSIVAIDDDGTLLVGNPARALIERRPDRGVRGFKRDMGTDRRYRFAGADLGPTELSAMVLREIKARAETALGQPVTKAVITVPAYFQEPQRAATREAGQLAGLDVVRMINEPTAAAIAYGLADPERERRVAVVDLGGGTFDVTILQVFDGVLEVVGTGGDSRLGGEDFTDLLLAWAAAEAGLPPVCDPLSPVHGLLRVRCEATKRAFADADLVAVDLPGPNASRWTDGRRVMLTHRTFEAITRPLLDRLARCIGETLRVAKLGPEEIDEIVLAGGATRMPTVRERVHAIFGKPVVEGPDPDLVIALGAASQGGLITRHAAVKDLVVTDVLSHSLGVAISRRGQDRNYDGYYLPVLHRNTTLPTHRVERVYTVHHEQTEVRVRVYQGEHREVADNRFLGEFQVCDIPVLKPGEHHAIDLGFTHDVSGLLEVEATIVSTGKFAAILIEGQAGRLDAPARARAIQTMARLKVHPRDLLPNRQLLEEARTRYATMPAHERALMDPPLFAFEDALSRQQPEAIAEAAALLRRLLGPSAPPPPKPPTPRPL